MTGFYITDDNCEYEVYYEKHGKPPKTQLMGRCIRSTVREPPFNPFPIIDGQIERNLNAHTWKKIS